MGVTYSSNQTNEPSTDDSTEDEEFIAVPIRDKRKEESMDPVNITTDAIESQPLRTQASFWGPSDTSAVTEKKMIESENNLEFYEKVSLVYLLYENADTALQHLMQLQHGAHLNVIHEWVQFSKKTDSNWQGKILEALCIIQNYEIIDSLGYTRKNVDDRFLPRNPNSSMYINRFKKKMYLIFESLPNYEAQRCLAYAKTDFEVKKLQFIEFDVQYLEMYILHWMTIKYITADDFTNLSKIFKYMERFDISDSLKSDFPSPSTSEQARAVPITLVNTSPYENSAYNFADIGLMTPDKSFTSVSSGASSSTMREDRIRKNSAEGQNYNIDPANPGLCLIINQQNFYGEFDPAYKHLLSSTLKPLEERKGTDIDRDRLKETFELFGFKVIVKNDLIHIQIIDEIKEAMAMVTNHSSLIICVLSHGIQGAVYGVNSIPVEVRDIQSVMCKTNTKNLKNKPKVLILQACQGTKCQLVTEEDEDEEETITTDSPAGAVPRTADMLIFWATVPGYSAVRDKAKGTWFIQALCKKIRASAHEMHFEEICTLVKREVIDKRWETKNETKAMVPYKESTLSKFFYLPPMKELTN